MTTLTDLLHVARHIAKPEDLVFIGAYHNKDVLEVVIGDSHAELSGLEMMACANGAEIERLLRGKLIPPDPLGSPPKLRGA